ncbi:MAG: nucleotide exchange factor GrpE [Ignavibacteria bacterium GWA2_35_9]|nr:MAG: nucleotide exchange factor GrpE [Ignavibacteria bacterium GWA2_35_9]OGU45619.1 MAG: nucleotide exchange factor GrpE [Ignavibacteria bacterium GWB2_36_8]OGU49984.1 MAG: nucleotide exchange factor GrpE [Ignavibacteria bacterium GWC2_36_12]
MDSNDRKKKHMKDEKQPEELKKEETEEIKSDERISLPSEEEFSDENKKLIELEKQVAELTDKFLRKAAEFENYKRRTENDQLNLIKYAAESFIIKLLPVIDDFERSLEHIDTAKNNDALKEGIKLVYDKLIKVLDDQGVKKIESVGKPFDVHYHEALMQKKADKVEPHTVLEELEKGYLYKDRVIRHTKVIVSEDSSEESVGTEKNEEENINKKNTNEE